MNLLLTILFYLLAAGLVLAVLLVVGLIVLCAAADSAIHERSHNRTETETS